MRETLGEILLLLFTALKNTFDARSLFFCAGLSALWYGIYLLSLPASLIIVGSFVVLLTTWEVFRR